MNSFRRLTQRLFASVASPAGRGWAIFLLIVLLIGCAAWLNPPQASAHHAPRLVSNAASNSGMTATPLPAELVNNQNQTIGLTLVAGLLVLVVVIATFTAMTNNPGDD